MRKLFFYFILISISSEICRAQNPRFSQIGVANLVMNPSLSGRFDGKVKAGNLMSWQKTDNGTMPHQYIFLDFKSGKYQNLGDEKVYQPDDSLFKPSKKTQPEGRDITNAERGPKGYWGMGFHYYHYGTDLAGFYESTSSLQASFFSGTLARHFYLKKNKYTGFGLQVTYAKGKADEISKDKFKYDKEISGGGFRYPYRNPATTQNRIGENNYFDWNIGGYYGASTEQLSYELGLAMYHLFYPRNDVFKLDNETKLRHRVTSHSVLRLKLSPKLGIIQKNVYWEEGLYYRSQTFNDSFHVVAFWSGVELYKIQPKSNFTLNFGIYTRSFHTVMPIFTIGLGNEITVRYTYEFPINSQKYKAYSAERTEFSLVYNFKKQTQTGTRFYKKFNYW